MADTAPPWLATMRAITGTKETPGSGNNQDILGWAKFIGETFPEMKNYAALYKHDAIAWCGLCVAYCMAKNGIKPVFGDTDTKRFLWARAWAGWGTKLAKPKLGCIMVFTRSGGGHVALYEDEDETHYFIRGGNQSNAVNVMRQAKSTFVAAVWPKESAAVPHKTSHASRRFTNITATEFADAEVAYADVKPGWNFRPGVALPARFTGPRPKVRVYRGTQSVVCEIIDIGPWNIDDPYWLSTSGRPQAESGTDRRGRKTNLAGIDLTKPAANAIGLKGKGKVDWEFIGAAPVAQPSKGKEAAKKTGLFAAIVAVVSGFLQKEIDPFLSVLIGLVIGGLIVLAFHIWRNRK